MILSIVGVDKVPDYVYYRATVLQEHVLKAGPVPYARYALGTGSEPSAAPVSSPPRL